MRQFTSTIAYTIALGSLIFTAGTIALAQNYNWVPLGSIGATWAQNGAHIYNSNSGSVVVGGNLPSGSLLLDVAGQVGATAYCDQNGANCVGITNLGQWSYDSLNDRLRTTSTSTNVAIGGVIPSQKLHVTGNVLADAFLYASDGRLKTNITPLSGLKIISQLEGVHFDWIDSGDSEVGVIAQQVEQVLPELVETDPVSGNKLVQYANLVAPLIQAVNEQQTQIEALRLELEQLQQ